MPSPLIVNGELLLYGYVGMYYPEWGIDGFTALMVVEALSELDGDITVRINSGGGYATEGLAIYQALRTYAGKVTVIIDGIAASAASVIAMAGEPVIMPTGTMMMIHDASGLTWGTATDHEKTADILHFMDARIAEIYAEKTGLAAQELRDMMDEETWLSGDEARGKGFADETTDDEAEDVTAFDYRLYRHAPAELQALAAVNNWALPGLAPAAVAAIRKEPTMTTKPAAATTDPRDTKAEDKTPPPPAASPATDVATDPGPEAAVKAAQDRIKAILDHEAAEGREGQARALAFDTELSVEQAAAVLAKGPKAVSGEQSFAERKAEQGPLGLDLADPGGAAHKPKAEINPQKIYAARRRATAAA